MIGFIKRYFIAFLVVAACSVLLICLLLFLLGYRLTLIGDVSVHGISTINTVASWVVPTILSITAIVISIETAKHQNRIALFEKRHELYNLFILLEPVVQTIENHLTDGYEHSEENHIELVKKIKSHLVLLGIPCEGLEPDAVFPFIIQRMGTGYLLFKRIEDKQLSDLVEAFSNICEASIKNNLSAECLDSWQHSYTLFVEKNITVMRAELHL